MATTLTHSPFLCRLPVSKPHKPFFTRAPPLFPSACSVSSSSEREEQRWLREEQRWLREEQRWLREEQRWREERERLVQEIVGLRIRVERREKEGLGFGVRRKDNLVLAEKADVKEMLFEEVREVGEVREVREEKREVREEREERREKEREGKRERRVLRAGAEGEDVQALQEALLKLGFYSGEEDMEFSSFSTGTDRAVKTWQASVGIKEDGIMTSELLELLFSENIITNTPSQLNSGVNGATVASVTETEKTVVKENDNNSGLEISQTRERVFLLGENRWEEPSRLIKNNNNKQGGMKNVTKCISCRGEGRLLCLECDGTGEPNIEPQFLEWVDEAMKCPYCNGLGYTTCDTCDGKALLQN